MNTEQISQRLDEADALLMKLKKLKRQAEAQNIPTDYPTVAMTVLENFISYSREDLANDEMTWVESASDELVQLGQDALAQIEYLLSNDDKPLEVPRYRTSPIRIKGASFIAETEWTGSGQKEQRPVFFTGYGHFSQVRNDIEKFPNYGINIIQIEFGPHSVFPDEHTVSNTVVEEFLSVLDRASQSHLTVDLLISPHYFPTWALEKYPHLKSCEGGFLKYCVDAPESRDLLERFLRHVIPQIHAHPALHSICLTNEPIYRKSHECTFTQNMWQKWLAARHGAIDVLNERYNALSRRRALLFAGYSSFADVPIPIDDVEAEPLYYDWSIFNQERFADWHRWMADIIHEVAPELPVHAKIMMWMSFNRRDVTWGVDAELFGALSQINGNDCVKLYPHDEASEWANSWQIENMAHDLQRSVTNTPVFNSENHLIRDRDFEHIPAVHIRNVLWQGAIHGQSATTIWVWERTYSETSDFAGSIMHRPACAAIVGITNLDLLRLSRQVAAIQNQKPAVALFYSTASIVYEPEYLPMLNRVYEALNFTGVKIGFVTERQAAEGALADYKVIIVPQATHVTDAAFGGLRNYVASCGKIVTVGDDCFAWNEYNKPRQDKLPIFSAFLSSLTAKELWRAFDDQLPVPASETKGHAWNVPRPVRAVDSDGRPVWGVELLCAEYAGGLVINLVNYTRTRQIVQLEMAQPYRTVNLFTGETMPDTLTLKPLEPLFIQIF